MNPNSEITYAQMWNLTCRYSLAQASEDGWADEWREADYHTDRADESEKYVAGETRRHVRENDVVTEASADLKRMVARLIK